MTANLHPKTYAALQDVTDADVLDVMAKFAAIAEDKRPDEALCATINFLTFLIEAAVPAERRTATATLIANKLFQQFPHAHESKGAH
jgi:hypothetical protein